MTATVLVSASVDSRINKEASEILEQEGLSVSDALRLLLVRVASDRAFPPELRIPNRETIDAIKAGEKGDVTRFASIDELMADLNADS